MTTREEVERWFVGRVFDGPTGVGPYSDYASYAVPTVAAVFDHARGFSAVVHAGGNIGQVPLALASRFARVLTFEAERQNFEWLARNVADEPRVEARYGALGDGHPVFVQRQKYSPCHYALGPGNVPCFRINDLALDSCDALVLDLEGGEVVALRSAARFILRHRPLVVVEEYERWMKRFGRVPGEAAALLADLGYRQVAQTDHDLVFSC